MTRRSLICPTCHTTGVPVMYGMPDPIVQPAVQEGRLAMGGCMMMGDDENLAWWCAVCDESFVGHDTRWAISQAIEPDFESFTGKPGS